MAKKKPKDPPMHKLLDIANDLHHQYLHEVQMNFPEEEWEERWKPLGDRVTAEMSEEYPSFAKKYGPKPAPVSKVQMGNFVNDIITRDKD
jgi:hypothetical protein